MNKIFIYLIIILLFLISGCKKESSESSQLKIITTIFPLYDFTKEIGKDKVQVSMLLPLGSEVHSYEPTPLDIIKINECSIFIYIGKSMEEWIDQILKSIKNNINIIEIEKYIDMLSEDNKTKDPHIWLDFEIDQKIVNLITKELIKKDPVNKEFYGENAKNYNLRLKDLDNIYRESLEKCELKTILYGGHFAFGYLAKKYGLKHFSPYKGFTPEAEPTPQNIAELIDIINKNKIEYLFYEELLEPKVAKAIMESTGVKLELLHAAHNLSQDEFEKNVNFLQIMEKNLIKLKKALKYKE